MDEIKKQLKFTESLVKEKGDYLLSVWDKIGKVEMHDPIDYSTKYDIQIEKEMLEAITSEYPDHGFFGEELTDIRDESKEFTWYADPIDGTKYFGRQVPMFTTILSLWDKQGGVVAAVYDPTVKELFSAARGLGAFINGIKISVDDGKKLNESIIALEVGDEDTDWEKNIIGNFLGSGCRVRIFGNATLSICWSLKSALMGYVDLFGMEDHDKKQDLAAPLLIAEEAGMLVKRVRINNKNKLYCCLPSLESEIMAMLELNS